MCISRILRIFKMKLWIIRIYFYFSCMNLMGLWCVLDESNSVSGFLFMDDGESIGK